MKMHYFIFSILILLQFPTMAQWIPANSGTTERLFAVAILSSSEAIVAGKSGVMLKTTDRGNTWNALSPGTDEDFEALLFLDELTGIAAAGMEVMKTTDGGNNWTQLATLTQEIAGIAALNNSQLCVVGEAGMIALSSDGGESWTEVESGAFTDMTAAAYPDQNTILATSVNGSVLRSTDAGISWEATTINMGYEMNDISFTSPQTGIIVAETGLIYATSDGGSTWNETFSPTQNDLYAVDFYSQSSGVAAGDDGAIISTSDGGNSWLAEVPVTSSRLHAVQQFDATFGVAAGRDGVILVYDISTNIRDNRKVTTYISPNPATDFVSIRVSGHESFSVTITDLLGSEVMKSNSVINETATLSISHLRPGVYFALISKKGNTISTQKIYIR